MRERSQKNISIKAFQRKKLDDFVDDARNRAIPIWHGDVVSAALQMFFDAPLHAQKAMLQRIMGWELESLALDPEDAMLKVLVKDQQGEAAGSGAAAAGHASRNEETPVKKPRRKL